MYSIYFLMLSLGMAINRRLDGSPSKLYVGKISVKAFLTRVFTLVVSSGCFYVMYDQMLLAAAFGILISISFQRGYSDWKLFNFKQITHHYIAAIAYVIPMIFHDYLMTTIGICCVLIASISHPTFYRLKIKKYTLLAEYITGLFLILPFGIYSIITKITN